MGNSETKIKGFHEFVDKQSMIDQYPLLTELHCNNGISPHIILPPTLKHLCIDVADATIARPPLQELPILPDGLEHLYVWCDDLDQLPDLPESLTYLVCYTQSMHLIKDTSITCPLAYALRGKSFDVKYRSHNITQIRQHQESRRPPLK